MASGSAFKPENFFAYLISFGWKADGMWKYDSNESCEDFDFQLPMPDSYAILIDHLVVDTDRETLGFFACPYGKATAAIVGMQKKADEWIGRANCSNLGQRNIWFLVDRQILLGLRYGLCCNTSPWSDLTIALMKQGYQIFPMGDVIRLLR